MFPNKYNQVRSLRYGIGNQDLPKTNLINALRYGIQLGSDFLTGSSISEALGYRPDVIKGQGYTPSYRDQFNNTVDLLRQGKTTEGLVKGAETLLTGTGAVGEGMMVAGAMTGPLAPLIIGSGLALKGLSKSGKLILQSKTGKKILANFTGDKTQGYNITDIELPKNDTSPEIKALEDNIDIPTYKTDVKEQIEGYKDIIYHTTDTEKGIEGELKTGNDLGFHLGETSDISRNAAIKSNKIVKRLKTEKFEINAKPEEILTINRKGGFFLPDDFANQLLEAKAITQLERQEIAKKIDEFDEKFGEDSPEYYGAFNKYFKDLLNKKNIKVIKYFNEYDSGVNPLFMEAMAKVNVNPIQAHKIIMQGDKSKFQELKNLDLTDTGINVKPANSYIVFDKSAIKKLSNKNLKEIFDEEYK
jgi:hypothetical protein